MIDSAIGPQLPKGWSETQLLFYIKPFLAKWRKTFPQFKLGVLCHGPLDIALWQTQLKASEVTQIAPDAVSETLRPNWDAVIVISPDLTLTELETFIPLASPYGMVLAITRNLSCDWPTWKPTLETGLLERLFTVGVSPQGGAAWWPFAWGQPVSQLFDFLQSIVPGKSATNLRWGQAWIFQGYRPYAQTVLTSQSQTEPTPITH